MNKEILITAKSADGVHLAYRIFRKQGLRPLITMVHGLASNMTRWSEFVEETSLKLKWDLLRVDLRGHGQSMVRGRLHGKLSHDRWCDDICTVLSAEGYHRSVFIGHSMSAQTVLRCAVLYPEKVQGLILIDPVFKQAIQGKYRFAGHFRILLHFLLRVVWFLNALGIKRTRIKSLDLQQLDKKMREILAKNPAADIASMYISPIADLKVCPTATYIQDIISLYEATPEMQNINVPVLVLLSKGNETCDPVRIKNNLSALTNCNVIEIEANHWQLTEKPVEVRVAIEKWCDQLPDE